MPRKINVFVILRILIGVVFLVSGVEKLISPYQNFMYAMEGYDFFPQTFAYLIARILPWIELFIGIFLILGLWITWSLRGALLLFMGFILVVSQAIVRKLPVDECGCFGALIAFPLPVVVVMDSFLLLIVCFLIFNKQKTSAFSLDQAYSEHE